MSAPSPLAPSGLVAALSDPPMRHAFARAPHAAAGRVHDARPLFDWRVLDAVVRDAVDVLTVARGQLVDAPPPRSAADVRALMRAGVSTVVRGGERHDAGLARLAEAFAARMPGEVHIQLYATPAGTNSFGWHWDFEDVFIAQTLGEKDYLFRDNTVTRTTRLGEVPDFSRVRDETSQLMTARLVAGDFLYLPRRWWHLVRCVEDSLSISVGVMPPEAFRDAHHVPPGWRGPR